MQLTYYGQSCFQVIINEQKVLFDMEATLVIQRASSYSLNPAISILQETPL